mgnify:CR=1 FL=1
MPDIAINIDTKFAREVATWEGITSGDPTGEPYLPSEQRASVATVQFSGTFDGATATLQGSNDGTNWITLRDTAQLDVSVTEADYAEISTAFLYIRPLTTGGGGSQSINCVLAARG